MSVNPTLTGMLGPWLCWVSLSALAKPPEPVADVLPVLRTVVVGLGEVGSTFIGREATPFGQRPACPFSHRILNIL
jgi:hypothetical protein